MGKWEYLFKIWKALLSIVSGISLTDEPGGKIKEEMKAANLSLCPQSTLARVNLQSESGSQANAIHSPWLKLEITHNRGKPSSNMQRAAEAPV